MGVADRQSMWKNDSILPKDCIPVAYLEFTSGSNAHIDTGIKPGNKGLWEVEVQINTNSGRSRFIGNNQLMVAAPDYAATWYPFYYNNSWNDTEMNISVT